MDDLFPEVSDYMIRVLAMMGSWVGAGATLLAVGVSLWLALRAEWLRLRIRVSLNSEPDPDWHKPPELSRPRWYVTFAIVNTSLRTVQVEKVGWIRRKGLRRIPWTYDPAWVDPRLPITLEPGDNCIIRMRLDKLASSLEFPRSAKAIIYTPLGSKTTRARVLGQYFRAARAWKHKQKSSSRLGLETILSGSSDDEPSPADSPGDSST